VGLPEISSELGSDIARTVLLQGAASCSCWS